MKATQILWMDREFKRDRTGLPKRIPRKRKKFAKRLNADPGKRLEYMFERAIMRAHKKQTAFGGLVGEDVNKLRNYIKSLNK